MTREAAARGKPCTCDSPRSGPGRACDIGSLGEGWLCARLGRAPTDAERAQSELTRRAREMIAGPLLTVTYRDSFPAVATTCLREGFAAVMRRWAEPLRSAGLLGSYVTRPRIRCGTQWRDGVVLTDLGRECARLLGLEVGRG